MNKQQRIIITIFLPIIIIMIGLYIIGDNGSVSMRNGGVVFNPIEYFSNNGIQWAIVFLFIGILEFFIWKYGKK